MKLVMRLWLSMNPESDPILPEATVVRADVPLGIVMRLPEGDRVSMSKAKIGG